MALHKEPYGLVYNDDGSLCVTLRKDDTPFEGVTSFAVEEGTTNLVENGHCDTYPTINNYWSDTGHLTISFSNSKMVLEAAAPTNYFLQRTTASSPNNGDWMQGKTYTLSAKIRIIETTGNDGQTVGLQIGQDNSKIVWADENSREWQILSMTYTCEDSTNQVRIPIWPRYDGSSATAKIEIDWIQLEQKPFATSFVDGSRTNGSLLLFDDATVRSWVDNGIVIAGWWKFNYWSDDKHFRVFSCTESGGFNIEKFPNYDIRLVINDGGTYLLSYFQDPDVFADLDWHFVVFYYRPDTKVAKVYVDAVEQTSVTLSQGLYFDENSYYSLVIGAELNGNTNPPTVGSQASVLVANLFIGKPLDKAGHLIWSDPYIQQLYQAKRPFSVPPKMPVI